MLTTVRTIGNSKGILIPAAFLASCQIQDKVNLQLQDGQIVIRPVKPALRCGWFDQASLPEVAATTSQPDEAHWADADLADDSEWVW